ncbi:hypothetical protein LguiA_021974 [Lonicera macranthoides]
MEEEEEEKKECCLLSKFVVGSVPTLFYIPDFITDSEHHQLLNNISQAPVSKWKSLKNRRLQNWGGVVHAKGLLAQDLPPWLTRITRRISEESKLFPSAINHVLINEYLPNQGIMPHQDGPAYFPVVAILSLGSPVVMDFTRHSTLADNKSGSQTRLPFSIVLMPRSLLIFKDMAYSEELLRKGTLLIFEILYYSQKSQPDFVDVFGSKYVHRLFFSVFHFLRGLLFLSNDVTIHLAPSRKVHTCLITTRVHSHIPKIKGKGR